MTYKEALEQEYKSHLMKVAGQLEFDIYEERSSNTGGALIKLKNSEMRIQFLNDRGIISLEIGSVHGDENFVDVELLASLIRLKSTTEPLSKIGRKRILNTRIGLSGQVALLTEKRNELAKLFSKNSTSGTLKQLEELGTERFNYMME